MVPRVQQPQIPALAASEQQGKGHHGLWEDDEKVQEQMGHDGSKVLDRD